MANEVIKNEIRISGLKFWEVADGLGYTDSTFSKKLRKEFSESEEEKIRQIIRNLSSKAVV